MFRLIILLIVLTASVFSQARLSVEISNDSIKLGEPLRYSLLIEYPKGGKIMGDPVTGFSEFEVLQIRKTDPDSKAGKIVEQRDFTLMRFDTGRCVISAPEIMILSGLDTLRAVGVEKTIYVVSILDSTKRDIEPEKPILRVTVRWWLVIVMGIAVLGILLLIAWLVYRYIKAWQEKKRREALAEPAPIPRSPEEIAFEQIELLRQKNYLDEALFKIYYSELSDILRNYLEAKIGISAMESTTVDIVREIEQKVSRGTAQDWFEFLSHADLVKFAKQVSNMEEGRTRLLMSKTLINELSQKIKSERV